MLVPESDSAQVKYPPPFAVLFAVALSVFCKLAFPYPFLPSLLRWSLGGVLVLGGIALMFSCVRLFKSHRTHIEPWKSTSTIMRSGAYRFSRNPIYLSFMLFVTGVILLLDNAWALTLLIPLFAFLDHYVIPKEERYLARKFGEEYIQFRNATRRWL